MPLQHDGKEQCTPRSLWKAWVLKKPQSGSNRMSREVKLRNMAEHVQQRLEHVRSLVQLRTNIEKEKQHVHLTRKSLLARLWRNEMSRADFENEMNDAQEGHKDFENKWTPLRSSALQ